MSTSPYHIASLLDKVRRAKFCFLTANVVCALGLVRAGKSLHVHVQNVNAGFFDLINWLLCGLTAPRYYVSFQFFQSRDLSWSAC